MSSVAINPYATPEFTDYVPQRPELYNRLKFDGLWRDGNLLVVTKGIEFPDICLKTNEPTDSARISQRFSFTPWWIVAVVLVVFLVQIHFGLLLCILLGPFVTRRAKLRYPASAHLYRRWQLSRRIGWNTAAVVAASLAGVYGAATLHKEPIAFFLLLFAGLVIVIGVVAKGIVGWRLKSKRITKHYIWIKGVHPDYLRRLPELPIRV